MEPEKIMKLILTNLELMLNIKLKSLFNKDILLLSPGFMELSFLGLLPKTIRAVCMEGVGWPPLCMACTTSPSTTWCAFPS